MCRPCWAQTYAVYISRVLLGVCCLAACGCGCAAEGVPSQAGVKPRSAAQGRLFLCGAVLGRAGPSGVDGAGRGRPGLRVEERRQRRARGAAARAGTQPWRPQGPGGLARPAPAAKLKDGRGPSSPLPRPRGFRRGAEGGGLASPSPPSRRSQRRLRPLQCGARALESALRPQARPRPAPACHRRQRRHRVWARSGP